MSFIAIWVLKTLKDQEPLMQQSGNQHLITAYSRMKKVFEITFFVKITNQVLKYLYYPGKVGKHWLMPSTSKSGVALYDIGDFYWYFDVVTPHVVDSLILGSLFLIWYPRPAFSHVDLENSALESQMEEAEMERSTGQLAQTTLDLGEGDFNIQETPTKEVGPARTVIGAPITSEMGPRDGGSTTKKASPARDNQTGGFSAGSVAQGVPTSGVAGVAIGNQR